MPSSSKCLYFEKFHQECPEGFIVAEEQNEILGYAIGKTKENTAEIIYLAVKPDFQQKGIGTQLIESLFDLFRKKGVKKASLNVRTGNKKAVAFHQKIGFRIIKEIKNFYRNGDNAYLMEKTMG